MSKGIHAFKESEIARAYRGAEKAGIKNPIIEVDTENRRLRIIPRDDTGTATEDTTEENLKDLI
jgi:hypothetical protein